MTTVFDGHVRRLEAQVFEHALENRVQAPRADILG